MKVTFQSSDLFTIEAEGNTHTEVFERLSSLSEVFSSNQCGCCQSDRLVPVHRVVDEVSFYEFKCTKCYAKLSMGQHKKGGTLYPRRRYHKEHPDITSGKVKWDKDNPPFLPNNGWSKYNSKSTEDAEVNTPTPTPKTKAKSVDPDIKF